MPRYNFFERRLPLTFPRFLAAWLNALPPGGYSGTSWNLWLAMVSVRPQTEPFPMPKALLRHIDKCPDVVSAMGFRFRRVRTKAARLVRIEPAGDPTPEER